MEIGLKNLNISWLEKVNYVNLGNKYEATPWFKPWATYTQGRLKILQLWWGIKFIFKETLIGNFAQNVGQKVEQGLVANNNQVSC